MSIAITISPEEINHQLKLSCQIPTLVEGIITRKIILSTAAELGLKVETEELQKTADNIRLVNKLLRADDAWAWLQKHHLSLEDFEELIYTTIISGKLSQHLFADKVEPFFIEHRLDYLQVVMYEIILEDEELAMELFYELQEGEINFYEIAHQYIQDAELRRTGGYRGLLYRKDLKAEISAAVFAATPPQILKPIVTSKGVHLILVEEIIQPQLDNFLCQKIMSDLFDSWLIQQIEQAEILR
ncbi:MAG: peptidylprolyl isomerase [Methylacidiphilales bacterium]|nr:peptidylprolyl isomerase [Candidatus Methylacidiphilales bacterium]NJR16214.1 peptidylprolyl isomerase [Calothrix sp. CSU_2_0]